LTILGGGFVARFVDLHGRIVTPFDRRWEARWGLPMSPLVRLAAL
jgi:hypothetical protein